MRGLFWAVMVAGACVAGAWWYASQPPAPPAPTLQTYTNATYGYSVRYLSNAELSTPSDDLTRIAGAFGTMTISPAASLPHAAKNCKAGSDIGGTLAGHITNQVEFTCGNVIEYDITFTDPPSPWRANNTAGINNEIQLATAQDRLVGALQTLASFRFITR